MKLVSAILILISVNLLWVVANDFGMNNSSSFGPDLSLTSFISELSADFETPVGNFVSKYRENPGYGTALANILGGLDEVINMAIIGIRLMILVVGAFIVISPFGFNAGTPKILVVLGLLGYSVVVFANISAGIAIWKAIKGSDT